MLKYIVFLTQKLHILFLCGWYPSKVLPTNGDFIQRHAEAVATKHNVTALHLISDATSTKDYIVVNEKNGVTSYIGYVRKTNNPVLKLQRFWKLFQSSISQIAPFDLVHLNEIYPFGIFALYLKKKYHTPYIISEHWTNYYFPNSNTIGRLHTIAAKKITKCAAFICPVSKDLKKAMQKFGLAGNYKIIPNVIDTGLFKPATKTTTAFTLIHISSLLDVHKNISGMLRVAKQLEEQIGVFTWKFIGGNAHEYEPLMATLQFKKNTIQFIPHSTQENLVAHLQQASLYVSFSNYETFGIVMPEAIACGTPVISTNTGILNEIKPQDFFKITPIKNEEKLLQEILNYKNNTIIFNQDKMHRFVSENFSVPVVATKFSALYYKSLAHN